MNIVQHSNLGLTGKFGNQLFQYSFAKTYSMLYDCTLEIPSGWPGRVIFRNITDDSISCTLPKYGEGEISLMGKKNIDLVGYFTTRNYTKYIDRSLVKQWFTLKDKYYEPNTFPAFEYNAVHLRRTDYDTIGTIGKECVDYWIEYYKCSHLPTIYVSDDPQEASDRTQFGLGDKYYGAMQDFLILANATNLFRCHSTYSWWAGELSPNLNQTVYAPIVFNQIKSNTANQFMEFVKGNHPAMCTSAFNPSYSKDEEDYDVYFGDRK